MIVSPQKRSVPPAVLETLGVLHLDPVNLLYQGIWGNVSGPRNMCCTRSRGSLIGVSQSNL